MKVYKIDVYIGSNNESGRACADYLDRVIKWANRNFPEGYTLLRGLGYFNRVQEDSVVISALTSYDAGLRNQLMSLAESLGQNFILFTKNQTDAEFVTKTIPDEPKTKENDIR